MSLLVPQGSFATECPPPLSPLSYPLFLLPSSNVYAYSKAPQLKSLFLWPHIWLPPTALYHSFHSQISWKSCLCLPSLVLHLPHVSASCNFAFPPSICWLSLTRSTPTSSVFFKSSGFHVAWPLCRVRHHRPVPSPCFIALFLLTTFHKWSWVAHQVNTSPGTEFAFYLHKHLIISNSPFRSLLKAPFPFPPDLSAQFPVFCLSSNYHRLQLDVLGSFYTPSFPPELYLISRDCCGGKTWGRAAFSSCLSPVVLSSQNIPRAHSPHEY